MAAKKPAAPKITRTIKRKQDYVLTLTFRDDQGNALDVSARTFTGKIATAYGAGTTPMSVGMGSAAAGVVTFSLAKATTTGLTVGAYLGEIWQTVAGADSPIIEIDYTIEDAL